MTTELKTRITKLVKETLKGSPKYGVLREILECTISPDVTDKELKDIIWDIWHEHNVYDIEEQEYLEEIGEYDY